MIKNNIRKTSRTESIFTEKGAISEAVRLHCGVAECTICNKNIRIAVMKDLKGGKNEPSSIERD